MGVFGPDGLSSRNISYTGKAISPSLDPGAHTTIESLVADIDNYEFVLHPGDFAYAGSSIPVVRKLFKADVAKHDV